MWTASQLAGAKAMFCKLQRLVFQSQTTTTTNAVAMKISGYTILEDGIETLSALNDEDVAQSRR
jgi:hypothetical protein